MKKILVLCLLALVAVGGVVYNFSDRNQVTAATSATPKEKKAEASDRVDLKSIPADKILVAYYSRTGDNYAVGNISKGNTHIMADIIAKDLGAKTFEIKTVKQYPLNYRECTAEAKRERETNARPELATKVDNMQDYDVIFLGYPIWYSDMPMAVYNFMESYDFKGKTIIPFCTSAGDVLTGKERNIPNHAKGATVLQGLGLEGKRVQENTASAEPEVAEWLSKLGFSVKKKLK
jgi:flavodoxin